MTLNFKNILLLSIALIGFLIFSLNAHKLNLKNKNISLIEIKPTQFIESPKEKSQILKNETKSLLIR